MTDRTVDIPSLAVAYRKLVLWFGGNLVVGLCSLALQPFIERSMIAALLSIVLAIAAVVTAIALVIFGYRTARALGSGVPWLWAIGIFVPCVNVITLLVLSSQATQACRARGVPVGFFGPQIDDRTDAGTE